MNDLKIIDKRMSPVEQEAVIAGPNEVILKAMEKNYSPELIEKMMALQERYEKRQAQKSYVKAMARFKKNPPEILKTKHVSYYNAKKQLVEWDHAELGEIAEAINKGLSEYDFFTRWDMGQPDKMVKTTCIITHQDGHSEQISMTGPPDTSGGKDLLKAISSTNTLQQRITLLALTGLAAKGMDIEMPNEEIQHITEKQLSTLRDLLNNVESISGSTAGSEAKKFCKWAKIESLEEAEAANYNKYLSAIKATLKKTRANTRTPGEEG